VDRCSWLGKAEMGEGNMEVHFNSGMPMSTVPHMHHHMNHFQNQVHNERIELGHSVDSPSRSLGRQRPTIAPLDTLFPDGSGSATIPMPPMSDGEVMPPDATTVMLRNLPNNYSRAMLMEMLDTEGFLGQYNFFYLPIDFKSGASLGYAFVNLVSSEVVQRFWATFNGFSRWVLPSHKICEVAWSAPYQGLAAHLERYRNSPLMHENVPDEYKPVLLVNGVRADFPPPTKKLRAPWIKHCKVGRGLGRKGQVALHARGAQSVPVSLSPDCEEEVLSDEEAFWR